MSDYTIDDTMAKIIYELSDREIYNDVRAEIGISNTETVVDEDPTYEWKWWESSIQMRYSECALRTYTAEYNALTWVLFGVSAYGVNWETYETWPYYDYTCAIEESDSNHCVVKVCNTGPWHCVVKFKIKYRYKTGERITHEEVNYSTLTVRVTDDTSIAKYGRRVMNLTWPQGASEEEMTMIANACLARYKEPVPVLNVTIQGKNNALATQIFTREISDVISVICDNLGLASTDFFIDKIAIKDYATVQIPICNWLLTGQRDEEVVGYFVIDVDEIDGDKLIG